MHLHQNGSGGKRCLSRNPQLYFSPKCMPSKVITGILEKREAINTPSVFSRPHNSSFSWVHSSQVQSLKWITNMYWYFKICFVINANFTHIVPLEAEMKNIQNIYLPSCNSFRSFSASSCKTDFCVFRTATYISRSVLQDFSASR